MSRLLRLYPAAWRQRYEAELLRLLHDRPLRLRDSVDVVRGAIDAHLHPELIGAERQPLTHRLPGLFALSAGVIWVTWFLNAYSVGPDGEWGDGIGYAVLLMFVTLPGDYLAAYARRIGIGIVATIGLAILALVLPWSVGHGLLNLSAGIAGYLIAGAGMVTLPAIRAGLGPRGRWLLLAGALLVPATIAIPVLGGFGPGDPGGAPAMLVAVLPYGIAWTLLGLRMTLRGSATIHDAPSSPRATVVPAT